jgi:hemerythrin-like metal-binding protein
MANVHLAVQSACRDPNSPVDLNYIDSSQSLRARGAQNFLIQAGSGGGGALLRRVRAALHDGDTRMTQFILTKNLYTGNTLIDGDHHRLVELVNALFDAMEDGPGGAPLADAMNELVAYSNEHFGREEAEMRRIDYVAMMAHQTEHAKLLKQVIELKKVLDAGGRINVPALTEFLGEWLRSHILGADMKLAVALKQVRAADPQPN